MENEELKKKIVDKANDYFSGAMSSTLAEKKGFYDGAMWMLKVCNEANEGFYDKVSGCMSNSFTEDVRYIIESIEQGYIKF